MGRGWNWLRTVSGGGQVCVLEKVVNLKQTHIANSLLFSYVRCTL
jgi:hypothetical protein